MMNMYVRITFLVNEGRRTDQVQFTSNVISNIALYSSINDLPYVLKLITLKKNIFNSYF